MLRGIPLEAAGEFVLKQESALIFIRAEITEYATYNRTRFISMKLSGYTSNQKAEIVRKMYPEMNENLLHKMIEEDYAFHSISQLSNLVQFFLKTPHLHDRLDDDSWYKSPVNRPAALQRGKIENLSCSCGMNLIFITFSFFFIFRMCVRRGHYERMRNN